MSFPESVKCPAVQITPVCNGRYSAPISCP